MKRSIMLMSLMLIVSLLFVSLSGCKPATPSNEQPKQTEQPNNTKAPVDQPEDEPGEITLDFSEPLVMDMFNMGTSFAGIHTGWFGKYVKDKWNMELNMIANDGNGDAKFQTLSASGNLGDMVVFSNPGQNFRQAVEAGSLLLDLSKDDLFYKYMPYYNDHFPVAVERMKTFTTDGSIYGIPTRVSLMKPTESQNATEVNYGIMIRYDYYLGVGAPKLNTLDDLIPVFEKMKEAYPETEEGKTTYAASFHPGMDNAAGMAHAQTIPGLYGYAQLTGDSILFTDSMAENYQHVLQDDGYYMKALKLFYDLNQKGLLDPDSLTQTGSDVSAKFAAGQIFYSNWYWEAKNAFNDKEHTAAGKGYMMAPLQDQKVSSPGFYPGGDNGPFLALGVNCKDPVRALNFFDWAYTPEGVMTLYNGPEGLTWEYGSDGKPFLTEFGVSALPMNKVDVPEEWGGSNFVDGFQKLSLYPLSNAEISPDFGEAYKYANWTSYLENNMSNLDKTWAQNMGGARYTVEYLKQNNMLSVIPGNTFTPPAMDTDMKALRDQVGNILKQYSWQMVFAKNESEFNRFKEEMITKANELGYDKLLDYYLEILPEAKQARADAVASVAKK